VTPVAVRAAATVLLVRDHGGIEVLMMTRPSNSVFAPGAQVFPGGAVDAFDSEPAVWRRCSPLDDARASQLLGIDAGGLAYWVAAVREAYEEVGILLATRAGGGALTPADLEGEHWGRARAQVDRGQMRFGELADAEDLALAAAGMRPFARWITPAGAPRRYDTRFFVAPAPEGQSARADGNEAVSLRWVRPEVALEEHRDEKIDLIQPTERSLVALTRFEEVADLLVAVDDGVARRSLVSDQGGWRVALPGDHAGPVGPGPAPPLLPVDR
jgi:8-oxo-dGTP pyrophosphatase MutT (NUDIX family)